MESGFQQGQNINTFTKVARRPFPWRTCECNMNIWLERSQSLQCLYFSWHEAAHISEILSAQRLGSIHSPSGKPQFTHGVQIRACRGEDSNATSALEHGFGPLSNWKNKKRSKINIHSYLTTISIKDGIPPAKTTSEFQIRSPLLKLSKIQVVHLFFSIEGALGMQARQCSQCMPAKKERENRVHYRPRSTPHLKIQLPSL